MMIKKRTLACCLVAAVCILVLAHDAAAAMTVTSPDGELRAEVRLKDGLPQYRCSWRGKALIDWSALGLGVAGTDAPPKWERNGEERAQQNATWKPVWGKREQVVDHYSELTITLACDEGPLHAMQLVFRAYNDGLALRYVLPKGSNPASLTIDKDLTAFALADDAQAWSYNGEHADREIPSIEEARGTLRLPVTIKAANDRYAAIMEAALYDFDWIDVEATKGSRVLNAKLEASKIETPFSTPWRVIMIGETPGALADSDLLMNLNPPCALDDPSWIKPGVTFWDWRAWGYTAKDGFTYGLNMETWKRFIDTAHDTGVPYLVVDANWYGDEFKPESDPTTSKEGVDMPALIKYAKSQDVGIILYLNDVGGWEYGLEPILKTYASWGASGIKYGFLKRVEGQAKVQRTRKIIELCAKYKLLVDFHDNPIPPSGDCRTWPNCITREYCHAQSDAMRAFTAKTFTTFAFVNCLTGSLDMNNGMFDLDYKPEERPRVFKDIPTTIMAEAARTLITFSGLTVIPDAADVYKEHADLFEFIAAQKMPWKESRTLLGSIGEYVTVMRQTGDTFLVASATNEEARTLSIPLDFLGEGAYEATVYEDGPDAGFNGKRDSYRVRKQTVKRGDVIKAAMAPGSGHCILIRKR